MTATTAGPSDRSFLRPRSPWARLGGVVLAVALEALGLWYDGRRRVLAREPSSDHRFGWSEEATGGGLTPVEVVVGAE